MTRLVNIDLPSLQMLCSQARPDEILQYEALCGVEWDRDRVATDFFTRVGPKWLLVSDDGTPLAAAGMEPLGRGVWQCWMVGTLEHWGTHWRSITKYTRRIMGDALATGARRLQVCCLQSRQQARVWYERGLLMDFNGELPQYGANGETACIYARVRSDDGQQ